MHAHMHMWPHRYVGKSKRGAGSIIQKIYDEIVEVMSGDRPVEVELPSKRRIAAAAQRPALQGYSPTPGSGAYAILMTLYLESQKPSYPGMMTKKAIQAKAQRFCRTGTDMSEEVGLEVGVAGGLGVVDAVGALLIYLPACFHATRSSTAHAVAYMNLSWLSMLEWLQA